MNSQAELETAWTPDIIGPIFKHPKTSLREVLNTHRDDKCTRTMATFTPDELIYDSDLSKKNFRKFNAVFVLINFMRFCNVHERYVSAESGGSYSLFALLNKYTDVIIEEVYITQGDVVKFTQDSMLIMWKVNRNDFFSRTVYNVIICAQKIQAAAALIRSNTPTTKLDIAISAGEVIFSVIGDENGRGFVIGGRPIDDIHLARRICLPGDLVLSSSAWEHCAPNQYEYVIKDSRNVKIIKVLSPLEEQHVRSFSSEGDAYPLNRKSTSITNSELTASSELSIMSTISNINFKTRVSVLDALRRRIGTHLRTYMLKPILEQIDQEDAFEHLTEVRQITMVCVNILPAKCTTHELISLVDQLFKVIQSIITKYSGCLFAVTLFEKDILFYIIYGVKGYNSNKKHSSAKNGLLSASQIMKEVKRTAAVKTVFIGVTTGMAFCGVVGHVVRRQYMIFGTPTNKAISLTTASLDKISCDYDTLFHSGMSKDKFSSRGIMLLKRFGQCHVYEFIDTYAKTETLTNLEYRYPLLGRCQEIEYFKDILDDIGVIGRNYAGLLIEGIERSGKSRVLDAFVTIVQNRQIKLVKLCLHSSHFEKSYSVLYYMFLQIMDAEDCTTIDDRERVLLQNLSEFLLAKDFCYLNTIMRVRFPLSDEYCADTDWERHRKTIDIFGLILTEIVGRTCVLVDDAQYMDFLSWQFLSAALNNTSVVLAMTMLEPVSWDNMSQTEAGIFQDKRLMHRTVQSLDSKHLAAFACQFLNVIAIPKDLEKILQQRSKNEIGWCEAYLMSALQVEQLSVIKISPVDVPNYDLVFPDITLLSKIPAYLTPEELAPPLHWMQVNVLNVCIAAGKPRGFVESNRDVTGLRIDIYNRMNAYEQDFIKCAAALGEIFLRNMIDAVMTNAAPVHTSNDSFLRKNLPTYAYCKTLEFTIVSFRKLFYDILSKQEKMEYHGKAASFFKRDARKCSTCGGGHFMSILSLEKPALSSTKMLQKLSMVMQKKELSSSRSDKFDDRRSVYSFDMNGIDKKKDGVNIRKISILPVHTDFDSDGYGDASPDSSKENHTVDGHKKTKNSLGSSDTKIVVSWDDRLKEFSYVDYRNCRCMRTVNCTFWKLHNHILNSKDVTELSMFMLEYSAGLIETAQSLYTTKYLATAAADIETIKAKDKLVTETPEAVVNKGKSLILMGDAYVAYGNYPQAKKYYTEAVALRYELPQNAKVICYSILIEKMRYKVRGIPKSTLNRDTGYIAAVKLELAVYLHRLSTVSMLQKDYKMARLAILQSLRAAFESLGGFLEQARIYLTAVQIFRKVQELNMMEPLEKPMLRIIEQKISWKSPEDLLVVVEVYQVIYENRILHGKLLEGITIGIKICKICNCLRFNKVKLAILPSLIEIMVWTKRINEAVDLLRELYYLSKEDTDYSAITWYHALCMELLLDAAMVLETYETCNNFYNKFVGFRSKTCVLRDPESASRLAICIAIWQLRMNRLITDAIVDEAKEYAKNTVHDKFSQIFNSVKGLECYLLILKRRINIRKSNDLIDQAQNAKAIINFLHDVSNHAPFVKPFFYLLNSYMEILRGRKIASQAEMQKSYKHAKLQGNKLAMAWIAQNKRTWEVAKYNNMAQYWLEHVGAGDSIRWQEIHSFSISAWSTTLFPFSVPNNSF